MNLAKWLIAAFHGMTPARHTSTRRPYSGDELRAIRKRNGVGRPPAVQRYRWGKLGAYDKREEDMRP